MDDSMKTIVLILVILYCVMPDPVPGPIDDIIIIMFGIAANEAESMGITLTASGFKLTSGSDYQLRNAVPFLNQLGTTYQYIAFK